MKNDLIRPKKEMLWYTIELRKATNETYWKVSMSMQ